jgi:hypothetical protein
MSWNRWQPFALLLSLLLAACASTRLDADWMDPQFRGQSLRGARILVLCESPELALKRGCEDHMASRLAEAGATPVLASAVERVQPGYQLMPEQVLAAARTAGAHAVFSVSIAPGAALASPGSWVSIGLGGFGIGGSGATGAGVGVGLPVGGGNVQTGYLASGNLTDVATGKLIWTGRASAPPSSDVNKQIDELTRAVVQGAHQAGLL